MVEHGSVVATEHVKTILPCQRAHPAASHSLSATICGCAAKRHVRSGEIVQPVRFGTLYNISGLAV
jgi:hypothetical protein